MKRSTFIKNVGIGAAGLSILPSAFASNKNVEDTKLKIGIIGVGARGIEHFKLLLDRNDIEIVCICDIDERTLKLAREHILSLGFKPPKVYSENTNAWKKMLEKEKIDAVIIATPWELHKPMIVAALQAGIKYVGTEVILGLSLQDHWDVVKAAEVNNAQVMMLENVCYRRDVMAVLNMVRQNVFGELIHLQGGYQHDLREVKFNDGINLYGGGVEYGDKGYSEAKWRTAHSIHRNGDVYPTHGIGPIANYININRGNRFVALNSFSSKSRGLHNHIVKKGGANHPNAKINFMLGDVVTTQIKCVNGETILLQHDTSLPRPYSLGFRVQGENGLWMDVNKSIHIEGITKAHTWDAAKPWLEKYDHPLWKKYEKDAEGAGHGGMDFFVLHAFVEAAKRKLPTPLDVYDAVTWSAITPLSEQSIEMGNQTIDFPDFTGGQWMYRKPIFAFGDDY